MYLCCYIVPSHRNKRWRNLTASNVSRTERVLSAEPGSPAASSWPRARRCLIYANTTLLLCCGIESQNQLGSWGAALQVGRSPMLRQLQAAATARRRRAAPFQPCAGPPREGEIIWVFIQQLLVLLPGTRENL